MVAIQNDLLPLSRSPAYVTVQDRRVVAHLSERAIPQSQVALREVLIARDCQTERLNTLAVKMRCFSIHDHRRLLIDGPDELTNSRRKGSQSPETRHPWSLSQSRITMDYGLHLWLTVEA